METASIKAACNTGTDLFHCVVIDIFIRYVHIEGEGKEPVNVE
jgi:hypothetical protein